MVYVLGFALVVEAVLYFINEYANKQLIKQYKLKEEKCKKLISILEKRIELFEKKAKMGE